MNHPSTLFSTHRAAGGSERWRVSDRGIAIPRPCSYPPVFPTLAPDQIPILVSLAFHRSSIVHLRFTLAPAPSIGTLTTLVRRGAVLRAGHTQRLPGHRERRQVCNLSNSALHRLLIQCRTRHKAYALQRRSHCLFYSRMSLCRKHGKTIAICGVLSGHISRES